MSGSWEDFFFYYLIIINTWVLYISIHISSDYLLLNIFNQIIQYATEILFLQSIFLLAFLQPNLHFLDQITTSERVYLSLKISISRNIVPQIFPKSYIASENSSPLQKLFESINISNPIFKPFGSFSAVDGTCCSGTQCSSSSWLVASSRQWHCIFPFHQVWKCKW